jgi:hypothetical protein
MAYLQIPTRPFSQAKAYSAKISRAKALARFSRSRAAHEAAPQENWITRFS